ncbi:Sua5 family C-terminal domain-containing protein [Streptomyces sp. NPDC052015]|uniref:Sua5 family C-terminal domain-containing protein n=1 Tax=Streptomyces sp. NPDC052015 TaxID=3154755 RepID=UPI003442187A
MTPSAAPGRSQGRAGAGVPGGRSSSPLPRRRPGQGARRGGGSRFHGRLPAQSYGLLRELDRRGATSSSLRCPVEEGLGLAIANRLSNAAGPAQHRRRSMILPEPTECAPTPIAHGRAGPSQR